MSTATRQWFCPECGRKFQVPSQARGLACCRYCAEEKRVLTPMADPAEPLPLPSRSIWKQDVTRLVACLFGILFVAGTAATVFNSRPPAKPKQQVWETNEFKAETARREAAEEQRLDREWREKQRALHGGDLVIQGAPELALTSTYEDLKSLTASFARRDVTPLLQLASQGRAFIVPAGTRALMVEPGIIAKKVRIMSGPQKGREGWIPVEFVSQ
jgi:hypothetical protein